MEFGEVLFYLNVDLKGESQVLALVSLYLPPDPMLLSASYNTLWSYAYQGDAALRVANVKTIKAVVAMVPHSSFQGDLWANFSW